MLIEGSEFLTEEFSVLTAICRDISVGTWPLEIHTPIAMVLLPCANSLLCQWSS